MVSKNIRQLNPFEIKTEIINLVSQIKDINNLSSCVIEKIELLDNQNDKKTIVKLLFKELYNLNNTDSSIICFLLERYCQREELIKKLWELVKSNVVSNNVKIVAINFLRGLNSDWELDSGNEVLNEEIINEETKQMLDNAIVNPEIQIDFLDFLTSLSTNDKLILINSLGKDYSKDALANILIPVFLSQPNSEVGVEALNLLGTSKSQLAFHALNSNVFNENLAPLIKKNLSTLKLSGIREDNSLDFYKKVLSESKPYRCCVTYPDGFGNQALIFTRKGKDDKIKFMAVVIDDYNGIRDCFGFYSISKFECDQIIERFYKKEPEISITPKQLKTLLVNAESISKQALASNFIPYEYICWKNIMADIESDGPNLKDVLNKKLAKKDLSKKDLSKIFNEKCTDKWFFDYSYRYEVKDFLDNASDNFDKLVEKNIDKIFDEEEKRLWTDRLLVCAYLKLAEKNKKMAEIFYNLAFSEDLKRELYKNILRKTIYEYYLKLKFDTDFNNGKFTLKQIDIILAEIEELWVCTK